jgi:hypothetical protein
MPRSRSADGSVPNPAGAASSACLSAAALDSVGTGWWQPAGRQCWWLARRRAALIWRR